MARLREIEALITPILAEKPETRDNDLLLYKEVLKLTGHSLDCTLEHYLNHKADYPSYESVSRCRRKTQAKYASLGGKNKLRDALEQEYIDYARTN